MSENIYRCLTRQVFQFKEFSIVPIRFKDRLEIMKWRNEQMYHLRQSQVLTEKMQNEYFSKVVSTLFDLEKPSQILFSFLKGDTCIGYGGLVHINWIDSHAEISFIMNTQLEREGFSKYWRIYLRLIEKVAFRELNLHKIFTYAFDLRPHLYPVLETSGFKKEATLKEHCFFDGAYKDVIIHKKNNPLHKLDIREVAESDSDLLLKWTNDPLVRLNSFNSNEVPLETHVEWFKSKLETSTFKGFIFEIEGVPVGLVKFDYNKEHFATIGISIDQAFRGVGLSASMISMACTTLHTLYAWPIHAYIKETNIASIKAFKKAGFNYSNSLLIKNTSSVLYKFVKEE